MTFLPVSLFPEIVTPQTVVTANYTGADARTVEQSVATPIEQQMTGVDNMNYMYSVSANSGQMVLTIDFDLNTDPNTDQILVQMRQTQASSQLPSAVNNLGVTVQKSLAAPLMVISLYSPDGSRDALFLSNYAYINLNDALTRVRGISNVQISGAGEYAMRLWLKPDQLANLNLSVPDIVNAVQAQNTVNSAGQIGSEPVPNGQEYTYTARAQGRLTTPEEFGEIIIRQQSDGGTVRLKDVARAELGAQTYNTQGTPERKTCCSRLSLSASRDKRVSRCEWGQEADGNFEAAISAGIGLRRLAGYHPAGDRRDSGNGQDADRSAAAGDPGGLPVPAKLACDA